MGTGAIDRSHGITHSYATSVKRLKAFNATGDDDCVRDSTRNALRYVIQMVAAVYAKYRAIGCLQQGIIHKTHGSKTQSSLNHEHGCP